MSKPPAKKATLRKTVPYAATLEVRDTCLCLHTQRAARALARRFDDMFRPAGLTNGQFSLLMALNRPEPPAMGPVARLLAMDRTTLTAALKPLQKAGLITIDVDPDDRRSRLLALTGKGHETLAPAIVIWRATHAEVEGAIQAVEADVLRQALVALG